MIVLAILATVAAAIWSGIAMASNSMWKQAHRVSCASIVVPWTVPAVLWLAWSFG